ALESAELWAKEHAGELTQPEQDFLAESRQEHELSEKQKKQNRRIRYLAIGATALSVIALIGICATLLALNELGKSLDEITAQTALANQARDDANSEKLLTQK